MKVINFTKMNGAGNDFILIDSSKNSDFHLEPQLIKKMCDRRKGIGADGILFIQPNDISDYELKYFNSDGSLGTLCGNGARCSIKYALDSFVLDRSNAKFLCNNKIFTGQRLSDNENFTFNLNDVEEFKTKIPIKFGNTIISCDFIDTGSPHAVFFWDEIESLFEENFQNFDIIDFGRNIRYAEEFKPRGTNVNFVEYREGRIYIRTYERGVEDETLACGTGTVASAILLYLRKGISPPLKFITHGNDNLIVDFVKENEKFKKITLTGPAKINYIGSYNF